MRLLIVEDDLRMQELVAEALRSSGHLVDAVATSAQMLATARSTQYDLLVVDLMPPDGDGLDAIRTLRRERISTPILVMTARGSVEDRIAALYAGADGYLIKPFDHSELLARVRALSRRPPALVGPVLRAGNIELDEAKPEVLCSGKPVDLRLGERRLLAMLMRRSGSVLPKVTLEDALSEHGRGSSRNAVEAVVSRLRKAFSNVDSGIVIETVRGVGYRLHEDNR